MTSGLDLPDWNQGLTTSWDPEVPAGVRQGGEGGIEATLSKPTYSHAWLVLSCSLHPCSFQAP